MQPPPPAPRRPGKVVILCGGRGTRLREETEFRPKPLVPVGDRPILWHVMKIYAQAGYTDFILALGYKGEMIKQYFLDYDLLNSDFTLDLGTRQIERLATTHEDGDWRITFVDTGLETMTGGRLRRLERLLAGEPFFMLTYGDGVADLDVQAVVDFHAHSGRSVVVTGVRPIARFGELVVRGDQVARFAEKPVSSDAWINGGFFVMTPKVFRYLRDDQSILEREPLERLAQDGELAVFKHPGYWQCMDTVRDMESLNEQWASGKAPWKQWDRQAAA
jgi:glucose-1-phosphate cytidylyltransferase